jgi:hypothetical protein
MTYYDTIAEDLVRAKQIIDDGKLSPDELLSFAPEVRQRVFEQSGAIRGDSNFVALKLLESFVAEIEYMQRALAESEQARREQFHQLRVIREMADLATGIDRSKNDPRPSGALGAVQTLIERWRRGEPFGFPHPEHGKNISAT